MARNLLDTLDRDGLDDRELQLIVQRHFRSASQSGVREIIYPGENEYAIKLVFSRDDRLTRMEAGAMLSPALEGELRDAIKHALIVTDHRVFRQVFFADYQLRGSWRYKNRFQVAPVPDDAPRLNCVFGDHPFVLEVRVACSKDGSITSMRVVQAVREAQLLLVGLVNTSIHSLAVRPFYGHWVSMPGAEYSHVEYLYPHYAIELPQSTADFSPAGALAPTGPPWELFGPWGLNAGQPLSFPDGLDDVLAIYDGLNTEGQARFLRSCYWLQRANRSFVESFSSSFMAVVTATEALFESKSLDVCHSCGQSRHGLRSSFSSFLETHVPLDTMTNTGYTHRTSFQARLKHLYDTRSQITHGGDLRGWGSNTHGFTPLGNRDDDDLRTLLRIMPYALGTWLSRQPLPCPSGADTPTRRERILRWLAVRAGRLHTRLVRACDNPKVARVKNAR